MIFFVFAPLVHGDTLLVSFNAFLDHSSKSKPWRELAVSKKMLANFFLQG